MGIQGMRQEVGCPQLHILEQRPQKYCQGKLEMPQGPARRSPGAKWLHHAHSLQPADISDLMCLLGDHMVIATQLCEMCQA